VPHNVAEWFVGLDDGGFPFLSTPRNHQNKKLRTAKELMQTDEAFSPTEYLALGKSASSLMWTTLYDILLEWIAPANRNLHIAEVNLDYDQDDIERTQMIACVDDLATVTGDPSAGYMQQLQAIWLSAFCALTGLVMHPAKVVLTIIGRIPRKYQQKSMIGPLNFKNKTNIIVYDHQWNPISCKVGALSLPDNRPNVIATTTSNST
jgi:hypothetical protein